MISPIGSSIDKQLSNGLIEFNKTEGKSRALAVLEIQHMPENIEDLIAQGRIVKIDL